MSIQSKRLKYLGLAIFLFSIPLINISCQSDYQLSGSKPNIIFILSDDVSYRDFSVLGQTKFETPNIDRLAREGIRFTNAYAGSPECASSRASLMTGKHMGHCRIRANRSARGQDHLLDEDITVAEILKKAGYVTGFIGKWGIGLPGTEGVPYKQGFDYTYGFYDQMRAHTYYPDYIMENDRKIILKENHGFNMARVYKYNRLPVDQIDDVKNVYDEKGILVTDGVADHRKIKNSEVLFQKKALQFIRENRAEQFFLYYATQIPHGPVITPDLNAFKDKDWSQKHKEWAAMMTHLDRGIGEMLELLEKLEILNNTIIFFAGDNGYSQWGYFGRKAWEDDELFRNKGPWRGGKFISREGGLRVPFFVYWPGKIKPYISNHICALYDFFDTAADLAGVNKMHITDGKSIVPLLEGNPKLQEEHDYLYWENGSFNSHAQSLRLGPWHVFRPHPSERPELYHINNDPACQTDLAKDHPEIIKQAEDMFKEAHEDSEWYTNPGESEEIINSKKQKAVESNSLQKPVRANSTLRN